MSVQVFYSDQPGQDPTWQARGGCEDWASAVRLVRSQPGFATVGPRAVASGARSVVIRVYSVGGESYKLEGPAPGPQD